MIDETLATALTTGKSLYEIVETYAAFGDHHTGTAADHDATDWLAEIAERLGAKVTLPDYRFERYSCRAVLTSDGATVPSVPLFYSGYGSWMTSRVDVMEVDRQLSGRADGLGSVTDQPAANRALAIAIDGPDDLAVHCNRVPAVRGVPTGPGRPAVIIPANWAERVGRDARLSFDAEVETAVTRNLVANLGSPDHRRVNITTPMTGWTPAAGERGTGLAVALAMAADLAKDHCVVLIGTSGHELDHLGLRDYLATENVAGQPVIHLGSCVATVEQDDGGQPVLGSQRAILTNAGDRLRDGIIEHAAPGRWTPIDPPDWPGEGQTWREAGAMVLSFLGTYEHFHLTTDQPEVATTPEALELATSSAIAAARHLLFAGGKPSGPAEEASVT